MRIRIQEVSHTVDPEPESLFIFLPGDVSWYDGDHAGSTEPCPHTVQLTGQVVGYHRSQAGEEGGQEHAHLPMLYLLYTQNQVTYDDKYFEYIGMKYNSFFNKNRN